HKPSARRQRTAGALAEDSAARVDSDAQENGIHAADQRLAGTRASRGAALVRHAAVGAVPVSAESRDLTWDRLSAGPRGLRARATFRPPLTPFEQWLELGREHLVHLFNEARRHRELPKLPHPPPQADTAGEHP